MALWFFVFLMTQVSELGKALKDKNFVSSLLSHEARIYDNDIVFENGLEYELKKKGFDYQTKRTLLSKQEYSVSILKANKNSNIYDSIRQLLHSISIKSPNVFPPWINIAPTKNRSPKGALFTSS